MKKPRTRRSKVLVVLVVLVMLGSALRESRILRGVNGLEWTDPAFWGFYVSEETYTLQNVVSFWGSLISLVLLTRRSPKVRSEHKRISQRNAPDELSRKGRDKSSTSPFTDINPNWKVVLGNPKLNDAEKTEGS